MTTGNLLLRQLASKFDLPLAASFWAVASGILLMFFLGGALGAVAVTQGMDANEIILTFVVLSALCLVALAASLCYFWEVVAERRRGIAVTFQSYLDAQVDISHYSNREAS
jgi:hypothetical protein